MTATGGRPQWAVRLASSEGGRRSELRRLVVPVALWFVCLLLTLYFHFVLRTQVVISHLYYLPIVGFALWWGARWGVIVAVFSGVVLLVSHHLASLGTLTDDIFRSGMFVVVAVVVAWLVAARAEWVRDSAGRFRALIEGTGNWIWEVDQDGIYTYASPRVKDLLGYEPEEVIGKTPFDLMPADEAQRVAALFREIASSQQAFARLENTCLHKDGHPVVVETSGVPIMDAAGEFLGYRGIDRDITDRKLAEGALRQSEQTYRNLTENLPDVIVRISPEGILQYVSPAIKQFAGYDPDEALGTSVFNYVVEADRPAVTAILRQACASGQTQGVDFLLITKRGEAIPVEVKSFPLIEDGKLVAFQCVIRDITERKRAEEALEHFKSAVESSSDAVGMSTPKGHHWYQNKAFDERFGDIGTDPPTSVFVNEEVGREVFATIMAGDEWTGEVEMRGRDGEILDILLRAYAIKDKDGTVSGIVGLHTDITERKRAEEALAESEEKYRVLIESSVQAVAVVQEGNIRYVNDACAESLGCSTRADLVGRCFRDLVAPEDREQQSWLTDGELVDGTTRTTLRLVGCGGEVRWFEVHVTGIRYEDNPALLIMGQDVTETKLLWEELNQQLLRDALTGVHNRRYFNESIIQEVKRADRHDYTTSFIMADIDGLKLVNDTYGHLVGDQILCGVGQALDGAVRGSDVVIRYGGDEFLVVMPETTAEQAALAIERIGGEFARWLAERVETGALHLDIPGRVSLSMGAASYYPNSELAVEEVLAQADNAMYEVKLAKRKRHNTPV